MLFNAAFQLILLIMWTSPFRQRTRASIASASLSLAAAVALSALSHFEHSRTVRPSTMIEAYILLSGAFDVVQIRTLWLQLDKHIAAVYSTSLGVKILILVLEATEKRSFLSARYSTLSPEATSGIFSRSTFFWLNNLFKAGFRSSILLRDLPALDDDLLTDTLHDQLQRSWDSGDQSKRHALVIAIFRSFLWPLLAAVPARIALVGFNFSQPFLFNRMIRFVGQPSSPEQAPYGYGLIGATALIYTGIAV